ncbi:MAG TPA: phosphoribosyltransferase family protein [Terriglobales bacterium]|nr:phosphoribosyltransferase family protein [Terriglobales bacterium]
MIDTLPTIKKTLFTTEQIQKRVSEIAKQVSKDYSGKSINVVCVLENGFMFMSDIVRQLDIPVICQFVRPEMKEGVATTEIFFTPEVEVVGKHILLIEALVQSGVTSEFLIRNFTSRGAATVKLAALLDKQSERRVSLNPDYFGFLLDESYVVGYGLGAPQVGRNLPYIGALAQ